MSERELEEIAEIITDAFNELEALAVKGKAQIAKLKGVAEKKTFATVSEVTFNILKFEVQHGAKIGEYEVAYKANNIAEKWTQAYNILRNSNATIKDRYHKPNYLYSYWIYGEGKIYRQKLKR